MAQPDARRGGLICNAPTSAVCAACRERCSCPVIRHRSVRADLQLHILNGQSHTALAACDVALVASGTATLEAALFQKADGDYLPRARADRLSGCARKPCCRGSGCRNILRRASSWCRNGCRRSDAGESRCRCAGLAGRRAAPAHALRDVSRHAYEPAAERQRPHRGRT